MTERLQRIAIDGNIIGPKTMHDSINEMEITMLQTYSIDVLTEIQQGRLWQNY